MYILIYLVLEAVVMGELFDNEFLNGLQNLKIYSSNFSDTGFSGARKSKSKGSSVEFSDFRQYFHGDDFRRIDWNAYGRFGKLFVKLFMEEREANIYIFLDISNSMDFGTPSKSFVSRRLGAAFAYMALAGFDSLNIATFNSSLADTIKGLRGMNSFPGVLNYLKSLQYSGTSQLFTRVKAVNPKKKGISIIISDLMMDEDLGETFGFLKYLNHEVYLCHCLSMDEVKPELSGNLRLLDSENETFMDITINSSILKVYEKAYHDFISHIEALCTKFGINYVDANTSLKFEEIIKKTVK
jgi:uncharacterized protein (DUF58 family)